MNKQEKNEHRELANGPGSKHLARGASASVPGRVVGQDTLTPLLGNSRVRPREQERRNWSGGVRRRSGLQIPRKISSLERMSGRHRVDERHLDPVDLKRHLPQERRAKLSTCEIVIFSNFDFS